MKIAVIGSRTFNNYNLVKKTLDEFKNKITLVISGGARGADKLGEQWADENQIEKLIFIPNWNKYKKIAGFLRNEDIIKNCDCCVAFWDGKSKGTQHSLSLCKKYNKPYVIIEI